MESNYSKKSCQTIQDYNEMYVRLQTEWRHGESVKAAKLEYRQRDMSLSDTKDADAWVNVVTQIKALEMVRELGWDTDKQVEELWQLADGIAREDEELALIEAREGTL